MAQADRQCLPFPFPVCTPVYAHTHKYTQAMTASYPANNVHIIYGVNQEQATVSWPQKSTAGHFKQTLRAQYPVRDILGVTRP